MYSLVRLMIFVSTISTEPTPTPSISSQPGSPIPPPTALPAAPSLPTPSSNTEPSLPHRVGWGPWKLGMSRAEVTAQAEFGPYSEVRVTGGVETSHGRWGGKPVTVSFVFGPVGLRTIQLWAYEGQSRDDAIAAFFKVHEYLKATVGVQTPSLTLPVNPDAASFRAAVLSALDAQPTTQSL
jgi:hypothetical protein